MKTIISPKQLQNISILISCLFFLSCSNKTTHTIQKTQNNANQNSAHINQTKKIEVTVKTGTLVGNLIENTTDTKTDSKTDSKINHIAEFKGIPFAAPPIGKLRWQAPQAATSWQGKLNTTSYKPGCMQNTAMLAMLQTPTDVSEDCLYLNVWAPQSAEQKKLPVMVWIYGGGFSGGATSTPTYDGTQFAKKGVVLVSIAYRIGALGFMAHPELSQESGKGSGNYGMQDQIAGLQWIKDNIAQFGGDPTNVTIFGESAGGISVSLLTASPAAKGLFHKAISQSGGSFAAPMSQVLPTSNHMPTLAFAENTGVNFLKKLGVTSIREARQLSADKIQTAVGPNIMSGFWPIADEALFLGDQFSLYQQKQFHDTPILIGTNSNEGALFSPPNGMKKEAFIQYIQATLGEHAADILAVYPHSNDKEASSAYSDIFRDSVFAWHTWAWAELQAQYGKNNAYLYYFNHRTPTAPNGADHGSEIAYVFNNFAQPEELIRQEDHNMSALLNQYWVNFATYGDPNGKGLPQWPTYTEQTKKAMFLDAKSSACTTPNLEQLKVWDKYYQALRESTDNKGK